MRYLIIFLLVFPTILVGQLQKANKLFDQGKYDKALVQYDDLRDAPEVVIRAAARFGYLKTSIKRSPSPTDLPALLQLHDNFRQNLRSLSDAERSELKKSWRVSVTSLAVQEKILQQRLAQVVARSDFGALLTHRKETISHPVWSDESWDLLSAIADTREQKLLEEALDTLDTNNLKALRIWEEAFKDHLYADISKAKVKTLKEGLIRNIVNNPKATYSQLSEIYNYHYETEAALNPGFQSLIRDRLLDIFAEEHGVDFRRFVQENPTHWFAQDCYVNDLIGIIEQDAWGQLPSFLQKHPYTMLDEFIVGVLKETEVFRQFPEFDQKALDQIDEEWAVRNLILSEENTSKEAYERLASFLKRTVPAPRCYDIFKQTAQLYLQQQEWERLNDLIALGRQLFVNGKPEDCDFDWDAYRDKQPWLKGVEEILRQGVSPSRPQAVAPASVPQVGESSPIITADDEQLFFARYTGNSSTYDIVVAHRDKDGQWGTPQPIRSLSLPTVNEVPVSITAAGNELLLFLDGRLAHSVRTTSGWSAPKLLEGSIAKMGWHGSATLSPDGQFLILESYRKAGDQVFQTNTDLYLAKRTENGKFDVVAPLKSINTVNRETSPYISPDGKTLYFSTNGRFGLGGTDVYVVRRKDDSWTNWTMPVNFGKSVNSFYDDDDFRLATAASGRVGYYSLNRDVDPLSGDIYSTELPELVRPEPFRIVKLPLIWSDSIPVADRSKYNVTVNTPDGTSLSGSAIVDGQVVLLLPEGLEDATVTLTNSSASEANILPITVPVDLKSDRLNTPVVVNNVSNVRSGGERIRLVQPYRVNQDDFAPTPGTQQQLKDVYALLKESGLSITIHAYSDNTGSPDYNRQLCLRRAEAVRDYLIEQGLDRQKIKLEPHGSMSYLESNDTEEGRHSNRRVELELY